MQAGPGCEGRRAGRRATRCAPRGDGPAPAPPPRGTSAGGSVHTLWPLPAAPSAQHSLGTLASGARAHTPPGNPGVRDMLTHTQPRRPRQTPHPREPRRPGHTRPLPGEPGRPGHARTQTNTHTRAHAYPGNPGVRGTHAHTRARGEPRHPGHRGGAWMGGRCAAPRPGEVRGRAEGGGSWGRTAASPRPGPLGGCSGVRCCGSACESGIRRRLYRGSPAPAPGPSGPSAGKGRDSNSAGRRHRMEATTTSVPARLPPRGASRLRRPGWGQNPARSRGDAGLRSLGPWVGPLPRG